MRHVIYINGTTDKNAVEKAYSYIQRSCGCSGFSLLLNQSGGLTMCVKSDLEREDIINALNKHLPGGAYAI